VEIADAGFLVAIFRQARAICFFWRMGLNWALFYVLTDFLGVFACISEYAGSFVRVQGGLCY